MNESKTVKPPIWFWVVSSVALIWNLLGLTQFVFFITMTEETLANMPAEQAELYRNIPSWVTICFSIGIFCGVAGSIFLLIRKKWALPVFALSLLGILGQMSHMFFISDTIKVMGPASFIGPVFIILVGAVLVWFSHFSGNKGWLT